MASYTYSPSNNELALAAEHPSQQPLVQQYLPGWISPIQTTPFIPTMHFTPSPMAYAVPLPPSPYSPGPAYLTADYSPLPPPGDFPPPSPQQRTRKLSWQGIMPQFLSAGDQSQGHHRRKSTGASTSHSPFVANAPLPVMPKEQIQLNPWLRPRGDILLDFSSPNFQPLVMMAGSAPQHLAQESLNELATSPGITKIRIECEYLPGQVFNITAPTSVNGVVMPLTVGTVLTYLWRSLYNGISMKDWQKIGMENEAKATKAYMRRCKSWGPHEMTERQKGVKWVDMLCGRVWFKGLKRDGDVYKLLVR